MPRILIAEDEPDMAMGLRDNLQFEGYEVLEATDGEEALRLVKDQRPDLMLLDIMMPRLDGLEVCKQARQAGFTRAVLEAEWPRTAEIPFDAERRRMTTLHKSAAGGALAIVKGAPEAVLERCQDQFGGSAGPV